LNRSELSDIAENPASIAYLLDELRLLRSHEMQELFPDATMDAEHFLAMKKSLLAIKAQASSADRRS
jgi:hypothetical protein